MELNEQTELTRKMGIDSGLSKKEKGLMDMDNSVVITRGREVKGTKGSVKNTVKIKFKKENNL